MVRVLTDTERGDMDGQPVPIRSGIHIGDLKRDLHCPSGTVLSYYRQQFNAQSFIAFVNDVITKPTGTALDGRLSWETE